MDHVPERKLESAAARVKDLRALQTTIDVEISRCLTYVTQPVRAAAEIAKEQEKITRAQAHIDLIQSYDAAKLQSLRARRGDLLDLIAATIHEDELERLVRLVTEHAVLEAEQASEEATDSEALVEVGDDR